MTPGSHASPDHGHQHGHQHGHHEAPPKQSVRRRRLTWWRVGTPVVVLVCGGLFVVSAVNSHGTDLRPGRYTDLATLVGSEASSYKKLEQQVSTLQRQVTALTNAVPDEDVKKAQQRADQLKAPAGLTAVEGPGVTITLSDAPQQLIDNTSLNPNLLVVHQQDIQAVVNALWTGGARAVTIQGQRIVTTTGIKCSGSTVTLQGVPYPQPYVIRAVGDQESMLNAIADSRDVQLFQDDAADPSIGIGWKLQSSDEVQAPAYHGLLDLSYARPLTTKAK